LIFHVDILIENMRIFLSRYKIGSRSREPYLGLFLRELELRAWSQEPLEKRARPPTLGKTYLVKFLSFFITLYFSKKESLTINLFILFFEIYLTAPDLTCVRFQLLANNNLGCS
jgi:hypothetical protein